MLLCVCLNPAIDVTYRLAGPVAPGQSQRVTSVRERAGGKGINVARVAKQLDLPALVLAPVGGVTGASLRADLEASGIPGSLIEILGPTRRTLAVVDPQEATLFNEPGPKITAGEWTALLDRFDNLLNGTWFSENGGTITANGTEKSIALVALSGSLPPGIPLDAYRTLTQRAHERGIPVMVDAEGEPLTLALEANPYLVKPNLAELGTIVGGPLDSVARIAAAGHAVRRLGARNVVVSCGADGLIAITEDGDWRASGPAVPGGNPTGAGDALVATLAAGTIRNLAWGGRLRDGVARSAAAVSSPLAGQFDPATSARLAPDVVLEELNSGN